MFYFVLFYMCGCVSVCVCFIEKLGSINGMTDTRFSAMVTGKCDLTYNLKMLTDR